MPTSTAMKVTKAAPGASNGVGGASNGRPSTHRGGETKISSARTRISEVVPPAHRIKKSLTPVGTTSAKPASATTTSTTKKPLTTATASSKRSTSAQRSAPQTTVSRSSTSLIQITPALRSVSPGGQISSQIRGTRPSTTRQLAGRKAETMKVRRTSLPTAGGEILNSRSVTSSPAAARRLSEKPVRRSVSPAAAYRRQSSGSYHRADTNCAPVPVPSLKIGRVERSHTMSSETTPRASTARPFSSPGRDQLNNSASASPKVNSSGGTSRSLGTAANTQQTAEPCTQLSSLVSLSDTVTANDECSKKQLVEGREVNQSWITGKELTRTSEQYQPTLTDSDAESDTAVEENNILCLTEAFHHIRKHTLRVRRGDGTTAAPIGRSAINAAVKGSSRRNAVALNLCLEHLSDAKSPRLGMESLHSTATSLNVEHAVTCSSLLREAALTRCTSRKLPKSKRDKFDSIMETLFDSGIPLEVGIANTDGVGEYELLCLLDDITFGAASTPVIACITTAIASFMEEGTKYGFSPTPKIPYNSNSLYVIKGKGKLIFALSAATTNKLFIDILVRCGVPLHPIDGMATAFLTSLNLKSSAISEEYHPKEKMSTNQHTSVLRDLRVNIDPDPASASRNYKEYSQRQISLIIASAYEPLVTQLFEDVLPSLRKEFLRVLSPQDFHEDKVRFCIQFSERVEAAAKIMKKEISNKITTTATTDQRKQILVTPQELDDINTKVDILLKGVQEDGENALLHDMFISLRHHAIASAPMAETSVVLVRVLHSNDFATSVDPLKLRSEVLKTFDNTAFDLCSQVHSSHVNNNSWIQESVRAVVNEYLSDPKFYKPEGTGLLPGIFVPPLATLPRAASALTPSLVGEVTDDVATTFLSQLQSRLSSILEMSTNPSTWDIGRPSYPITESLCRAMHEAVFIERMVLWPEGCRLKPTFYAGLVDMFQKELVREYSKGEEVRLQNIIEVEVASVRRLVDAALGERLAVKIISKYVATIHTHALKMGVLRAFQVDITKISSCKSFYEVHAEAVSTMIASYKDECERFADHISHYVPSESGGVWDSFFAYLQSFRSNFFKTANTFAVIVPFNRLDASVVSFQAFISLLPNDIRHFADQSNIVVPDSMISRSEFLPPLGYARGQPALPPFESIYNNHFWGQQSAVLQSRSDASECDCWVSMSTTTIPVSELPLSLLAASPTASKEEQRVVVEWPPRLYFSLSVADSTPKAWLRFDSHGSYCLVTAVNPVQPIGSSDVIAMEESRDGYICIPLPPGEYTALVCNSGGRSKLQLVDEVGSTLNDGGVQILPNVKHQCWSLSPSSLSTSIVSDAIGPLSSPNWLSLTQVALSVVGSAKKSLTLLGPGSAFTLFKGSGRVTSLSSTSTDFVAVSKSKMTPFGEMAFTLLEEGDYIIVPFVPAKDGRLCVSSDTDDCKVVLSVLPPEASLLGSSEPVVAVWDYNKYGNDESPQFLILTNSTKPLTISVHNAGWLLHTLDGELVHTCDTFGGVIACEKVVLPSSPTGHYILTTFLSRAEAAKKHDRIEVTAQVIGANAELSLLSETNHILNGSWAGITAGGGTDAPTFCNNPQYIIATGDEEAEVVININRPKAEGMLSAGVVVFERNGNERYRDFALRTSPVVASATTEREGDNSNLSCTFTASPRSIYTLVPYLSERGSTDEIFTVAITASRPLLAACPVLEWPSDEHIDGFWEGSNQTNSLLDNPQFVVTVSKGSESVVSLAAFGLGNLALHLGRGEIHANHGSPDRDDRSNDVVESASPLTCISQIEATVGPTGCELGAFANQIAIELPIKHHSTQRDHLSVEKYIICCTAETPGVSGSFRASVFSDKGRCSIKPFVESG